MPLVVGSAVYALTRRVQATRRTAVCSLHKDRDTGRLALEAQADGLAKQATLLALEGTPGATSSIGASKCLLQVPATSA